MSKEYERMIETTRGPVADEVFRMVNSLSVNDFTVTELLALMTVVRPVYDRVHQVEKPAPLKLVTRGRRGKR